MTLVEKIANELIELFGKHQEGGVTLADLDDWHQKLWGARATQILQAILSDPSIVEIEVGAELPEAIKKMPFWGQLDSILKQAGWVKKKDGGGK